MSRFSQRFHDTIEQFLVGLALSQSQGCCLGFGQNALLLLRLASILVFGIAALDAATALAEHPASAAAAVFPIFVADFVLVLATYFVDPGTAPIEQLTIDGDAIRVTPGRDGRAVPSAGSSGSTIQSDTNSEHDNLITSSNGYNSRGETLHALQLRDAESGRDSRGRSGRQSRVPLPASVRAGAAGNRTPLGSDVQASSHTRRSTSQSRVYLGPEAAAAAASGPGPVGRSSSSRRGDFAEDGSTAESGGTGAAHIESAEPVEEGGDIRLSQLGSGSGSTRLTGVSHSPSSSISRHVNNPGTPRAGAGGGTGALRHPPASARSTLQATLLAARGSEQAHGAGAVVQVRTPLRSQADPRYGRTRRSRSMPPVPLKPVPRFDHFAPLLGTCIGAKNLLLFTLQLAAWAAAASTSLLLSLLELWAAEEATMEGALWVVLVLGAAAQAVYVGEEVWLHGWLLAHNLTRHELRHQRRLIYMRQAGGAYPRLQEASGVSIPFVRGSMLNTVAEGLGLPGGKDLYGAGASNGGTDGGGSRRSDSMSIMSGWHDWVRYPVWTVMDLMDHPLRAATLDKLADVVLAAERAGVALQPQQRLAVRLAERCGALAPVLARRRIRFGGSNGNFNATEMGGASKSGAISTRVVEATNTRPQEEAVEAEQDDEEGSGEGAPGLTIAADGTGADRGLSVQNEHSVS